MIESCDGSFILFIKYVEYRGKGIGSKVLHSVNKWVKENNYEFVIVWPSEDAIPYYEKNGYVHCKEPMEYFPT